MKYMIRVVESTKYIIEAESAEQANSIIQEAWSDGTIYSTEKITACDTDIDFIQE